MKLDHSWGVDPYRGENRKPRMAIRPELLLQVFYGVHKIVQVRLVVLASSIPLPGEKFLVCPHMAACDIAGNEGPRPRMLGIARWHSHPQFSAVRMKEQRKCASSRPIPRSLVPKVCAKHKITANSNAQPSCASSRPLQGPRDARISCQFYYGHCMVRK